MPKKSWEKVCKLKIHNSSRQSFFSIAEGKAYIDFFVDFLKQNTQNLTNIFLRLLFSAKYIQFSALFQPQRS